MHFCLHIYRTGREKEGKREGDREMEKDRKREREKSGTHPWMDKKQKNHISINSKSSAMKDNTQVSRVFF